MALPTNKITKIKLPNNTIYEIIPMTLRDGTTTYKVSVPTLTQDDTVAVTSTTPVIYSVSNIGSISSTILGSLKTGDLVKVPNTSNLYSVVATNNNSTAVKLCNIIEGTSLQLVEYSKSNNTWTCRRTYYTFVTKCEADLEDPSDVFSYQINTGDIFIYPHRDDDNNYCSEEYIVSKYDVDNEEYWFTHVGTTVIKEFHYWDNGQGGMNYEYNEYPVGGGVEIDDLTNL